MEYNPSTVSTSLLSRLRGLSSSRNLVSRPRSELLIFDRQFALLYDWLIPVIDFWLLIVVWIFFKVVWSSTIWRSRSPTLWRVTFRRSPPSFSSSSLTFRCLLAPSPSSVSILEPTWCQPFPSLTNRLRVTSWSACPVTHKETSSSTIGRSLLKLGRELWRRIFSDFVWLLIRIS